jgi:uncharacterized protein YndB with AHSA1/START domain
MLCMLLAWPADSQEVHNTSYVSEAGQKVLRIDMSVPVPVDRLWHAWTRADELRHWVAPVVEVDFRTGGVLSTNYDAKGTIGAPGTIRLPIVACIDRQLIVLKVNLNADFPRSVRGSDQQLLEIVQLVDAGDGHSVLRSSMVGWGAGPDWDKAYDFFARGNEWTYRNLAKYLVTSKPNTR